VHQCGPSRTVGGRLSTKRPRTIFLGVSEFVSESDSPPPHPRASGSQYILRPWMEGGGIFQTDDVGQGGGGVTKKSFLARTPLMDDPL